MVRYWILFLVKLLIVLLVPYLFGYMFEMLFSQGYGVVSLFWSTATIPMTPPALSSNYEYIGLVILILPSLYFTLRLPSTKSPQAKPILTTMTLLVTWLCLQVLFPLLLVDFDMLVVNEPTIPYLSVLEPFTTLVMFSLVIEPSLNDQRMADTYFGEKKLHWFVMIALLIAPIHVFLSPAYYALESLITTFRILPIQIFVFNIQSPPSFPIDVFTWLFTLIFLQQLYQYLNGKVSFKQLRLFGVLSIIPQIALSIIHILLSTLIGTWVISLPLPFIQMFGYIVVRRTSRPSELDDLEKQDLEIPTIYIIYSWIKKKIRRRE